MCIILSHCPRFCVYISILTPIIPYKEIQNEKNITFVVITKDETTLEKIIKSITTFHDSHKDMEINVVISSSYQKLHKLSGGIF